MQTDYKVARMTRHDDGRVEVVARVYEGDVTTELEPSLDGRGLPVPVTRYRRTRFLRTVTLSLPDLPLAATEAQVRRRLNDELKKDTTRTPIVEQV